MQSRTETYAGTSGTLPLRLYVGRRLGPRWTLGARRPKPRRGLRGRGCPRWGNAACAAFARETPTALVAKQSAGGDPVRSSATPPRVHEGRRAQTPVTVGTPPSVFFLTTARLGFGVVLFGSKMTRDPGAENWYPSVFCSTGNRNDAFEIDMADFTASGQFYCKTRRSFWGSRYSQRK